MRPSDVARREREPLGVPEVARVLERDPHRERVRGARGLVSPRSSPTSRTLAANASRALVAEEPAELLQVRPAARRS